MNKFWKSEITNYQPKFSDQRHVLSVKINEKMKIKDKAKDTQLKIFSYQKNAYLKPITSVL